MLVRESLFRSARCLSLSNRFNQSLFRLKSTRKMGNSQGNSSEFPFPMMTNCRIVVVGPQSGDECLVELANLPKEARILATGSNLEELRKDGELFTEVLII
jgi:hypothetical protein